MRLTPAEEAMIDGILRGASNKQIAHELRVAEQTIKNRLGDVYRKLGVENRVQLALLAVRREHASLQ